MRNGRFPTTEPVILLKFYRRSFYRMWPLTRIDPPLLMRNGPLKRVLNSATVLVG
jgi:hypothetical protein